MVPLTLVVLDGWGLSPEVTGNAILTTPTPNFDKLMSIFPYTSLHASSEEVGLAWGEMGNSEVGHLNLGTGRIIMQDLPRIDKTITDKTFFQNQELIGAFKYATENNGDVHFFRSFFCRRSSFAPKPSFSFVRFSKKNTNLPAFLFILLLMDGTHRLK